MDWNQHDWAWFVNPSETLICTLNFIKPCYFDRKMVRIGPKAIIKLQLLPLPPKRQAKRWAWELSETWSMTVQELSFEEVWETFGQKTSTIIYAEVFRFWQQKSSCWFNKSQAVHLVTNSGCQCKKSSFGTQKSFQFTMIFKFIHLQKFIFDKNVPYFWLLKPKSTKLISPHRIADINLVKPQLLQTQ